jgi:hypothetical protein
MSLLSMTGRAYIMLGQSEIVNRKFLVTNDFNLAEYEIHLLRLEHLHHLPPSVTIAEIENKLKNVKSLMNPAQILKTLKHIFALIPISIS